MAESTMERGGEADRRLSRRSVLKTGAAAGLAAVAVIAARTPAKSASDDEEEWLDLDVMADTTLLDVVTTPNGGPFYIPGEIFAPGTDNRIGQFHCWGFFYNGGALGAVSQEFDLMGHGKIQVQGVEDEGPRAVTGGTGAFRNVCGEMTGADLSAFPFFTVNFRLTGLHADDDDDDDD